MSHSFLVLAISLFYWKRHPWCIFNTSFPFLIKGCFPGVITGIPNSIMVSCDHIIITVSSESFRCLLANFRHAWARVLWAAANMQPSDCWSLIGLQDYGPNDNYFHFDEYLDHLLIDYLLNLETKMFSCKKCSYCFYVHVVQRCC